MALGLLIQEFVPDNCHSGLLMTVFQKECVLWSTTRYPAIFDPGSIRCPDDSFRLFSRHRSGIVASVLCPVASGHTSTPDAPVVDVTAQRNPGWPDHGHAET